MEFSILYAIQHLRCDAMDAIILFVTKFAGSYGQLWPIIGAVLCVFKKTRKCGAAMLLSYGLVFVVGQYGLKDWIARARPCHIDEAVELLVSRPSSYSCPSTHSAWSFAAAVSVLMNHKKWGWVTLIAAVVIAFSRLYLFVHFPSDVLFGALLGAVCAFAAVKLISLVIRKLSNRKTA